MILRYQSTILIFFVFSLVAGLYTGELDAQNISVELPGENILSLEQVIQLSVVNNPEVKRAFLSVEEADQQVRIAWSEVLPTISSSANYTRNIEIPVNFVPARVFDPGAPADELIPLQFGTDNNWQGGVTVSQNIFRGEAIVGISSSAIFKSAQQENLRATKQQIVTSARIGYHAVLFASEQLRLQRATIDRLTKNLAENRSRLQAGLVDEYDVLRIEVQLANQEPQLKEAELAVNEAYRNLKQLMGLPLDMPLELEGRLSEFDMVGDGSRYDGNRSLYKIDSANPASSLSREEAKSMMHKLRGDLRLLDVQEELKNREIRAIQSRFLPTITADYNLQWTAAQPGNPRPFENSVRFQTVMVNFSLPLFTGFERRANLNIAKIEKRDIQVQQWAAENAALNQYDTLFERIQNQRDTAIARRKAVEQARRGYEIAEKRFENGIGSQFDVTEAELQVREAELNYSALIADYLNTKAEFDLALGLVPMIDETEYNF